MGIMRKHLVEYQPGTYGDFISNVVAYSVDGFYYNCDETFFHDAVYQATVPKINYEVSFRGGGYEFLPKLTDFIVDKCVGRMGIDTSDDMLFNMHPRWNEEPMSIADTFRTLTHTMTNCTAKFLTLDCEFDTILLAASNLFFVDNPDYSNSLKKNPLEIRRKFDYIARIQSWANTHLANDQKLNIGCITALEPEMLSVYGNVDTDKFNELYNLYNERKMEQLVSLRDFVKIKLDKRLLNVMKEGLESLKQNPLPYDYVLGT